MLPTPADSPETATTPAPTQGAASERPLRTACPRCETKLVDPAGLSLCPKCGWCRSLAETRLWSAEPVQTKRPPSRLGGREFLELIWKSPCWLWILAGGLVVVGAVTAAADAVLPPEGLVRALWTTGQIAVGLLFVLGAQAWALILFAPKDDKLGAKDLFLSGRLWGLILKRLPATQWQVGFAVWGLTLAVSGAAWVGGLSYYLPKGTP